MLYPRASPAPSLLLRIKKVNINNLTQLSELNPSINRINKKITVSYLVQSVQKNVNFMGDSLQLYLREVNVCQVKDNEILPSPKSRGKPDFFCCDSALQCIGLLKVDLTQRFAEYCNKITIWHVMHPILL